MTEENTPPTRTCATCACSDVLKHPQEVSRTQRVCRLNPPTTVIQQQRVNTPGGPVMQQVIGLTQQPTTDDTVCWQWKEPGTLPGDRNVDAFTKRIVAVLDAVMSKSGVGIEIDDLTQLGQKQ